MTMELPIQIDNVNKRVVDDLRSRLKPHTKVSIAAASFSIYAFEALKKELEQVDELRFIFTSPTFVKDKNKKEKREFFIPKLNRERNLYGTDFEIKLRNKLSQKAIAKECADWVRRKVKFKSNISNNVMGGFMYVKDTPDNGHVYLPFNEFTTTELGCEQGNNVYQMINVLPSPAAETYLKIFNEQWDDDANFSDVTDKILEYIDTVYQENPPEYLYFITLYNIFNEFLEDISEDVLPNDRVGFKDSVIWNKLYNFQRDAAIAIINKLEKYNGCILADSVGLGKTFTALAVIKYYEMRNKSVLVLCPKKLNDNWMTFRANYKNNPIAADRLRYDILFHTDLTRDRGVSNGLDLEHINWGNYDLVVIDESHNFRNGGNIDEEFLDEKEQEEDFKENRYQRLMQRVIRQGVQTKVLMLSATPVNNRFIDLKNQLQLAYEGHSEQIDELLDTESSIDDIFTQAQKAYNRWAKLPAKERTTENLLDSLDFDFFTVLDAVTIARSRKHIVKYYDTKDIGNFPKRLPPVSRRPGLTEIKGVIDFREIAGILNHLNLSLYTPSLYIYQSVKDRYEINLKGSGISIDGREKGMRKLMATNLLKRLESSVNSFRLTLSRIVKHINDTIKQIDDFEKKPQTVSLIDDTLDMVAEDIDENLVGGNSEIDLRDMDYTKWRYDLKQDLAKLNYLLESLEPITPEHDLKLQTLVEDLRAKYLHPFNPDNHKVLIFTAFSDTAEYLYNNLAERIKADTGMNVALITGNTEGKCTIPKFPLSFNNILTYFSPRSKDRDALFPNATEDIDILIATDCISEGQNLQDCDELINYDIHWNPVRIIQRFGRIDRIGSKNRSIQLINYWPDMELDEYINLKGRVESRMKATVLTSTGDDNPLSETEKGDLEYRRNQLKKLQEEVVDLEDMDSGINIMDLGLNEFRMDLLAYMKENPDVEHAPYGMNAVVHSSELAKPGVIFILKNRNNDINIDHKNLLHPFYMVYLGNDGEVICDHLHPKKLLDTLRHLCRGKAAPDMPLCKSVNRETKDGRDMSHYSDLLQQAINSIISIKEENDIDSLFSPGPTTALEGDIKGLDDFELIAFFIIR